MPVQTQTVLKSYFETGDTPTEQQFADLIDTFFFHNQAALVSAANAEAVAAAADVRAPSCIAKYDGGLFANVAGFNVASLTNPDLNRFRVTFTTVIAVPYAVLVTPHALSVAGPIISWKVIEATNDHVDIVFRENPTTIILPAFSLAIFAIS